MLKENSVRWRWGVIAVGAFTLLMGIEIWTEDEALDWPDLFGDAISTALIVASSVGVTMLASRFQDEHDQKEALVRDLQMARAEGAAWRDQAQSYLNGLGEEIEKQFETWQLTGAEREVGLLMLKGFSHREIAGLRGTTEATVRHQARAVYQKSNLTGRAGFCAYFLEDLLPMRDPGHQESASA